MSVRAIGGRSPRTGQAFIHNRLEPLEPRTLLSGDGLSLAEVYANDAASGDAFGGSIAAAGTIVVAGSPFDDQSGHLSGSAYVFEPGGGGWSQSAKLTANDAAADDQFGFDVDTDGDVIVVGTPKHDGVGFDSGAAYVFVRSGAGWMQLTKLTANDAAQFDNFGYSVGVSGDVIVVGAFQDDDGGSNSGSAYIFERDDAGTPDDPTDDAWNQTAKLVANDASSQARFGQAVDADGDNVVIAAPRDGGANVMGAAYVFTRDVGGWSQQQKINADDAAPGDAFGWAVDMEDGMLVVGQAQMKFEPGAAYVFTHDGVAWQQQAKLSASDGVANDQFGQAVATNGQSVVVGATALGTGGAAYLFDDSSGVWSQSTMLQPDVTSAGDAFGSSVAMSDAALAIGASGDSDMGLAAGSAHIANLGAPPDDTPPDDPPVDDTPPATPDAPALAPGSDTGVSDNDGLTNDNTPTLTGQTEPGAVVDVFNGDVHLGSTTADADGNWSFTTPALNDGDHTLTVTATDADGNTSEPSAALHVTIDTQGPAVDAFELGADSRSIVLRLVGDDIDPATAENVSVYRLTDVAEGQEFVAASATWDAAESTVTLHYDESLFDRQLTLEVDGDDDATDGVIGLQDAAGNHLVGGDVQTELDNTLEARLRELYRVIDDMDLSRRADRVLRVHVGIAIAIVDRGWGNDRTNLALVKSIDRQIDRLHRKGKTDDAAHATMQSHVDAMVTGLKDTLKSEHKRSHRWFRGFGHRC